MKLFIILSLVYIAGFYFSYTMQRIEAAAAKEIYSKGDRLLNICLSLLSWVWVVFILISTWIGQPGLKEYWKKPVEKIEDIQVVVDKEMKVVNRKTASQ